MQIIPVIDLKNQQVVLAKSGERNNYQPISTSLCPSADPFDVMQRFLELHPFTAFYIADLDAIMRQGEHNTLIDCLLEKYPEITFWIDNGLKISDFNKQSRPKNYKTIIGSESQASCNKIIPREAILSLDFKEKAALGDQSLFSRDTYWPDTIIIMTLSQIGMNNGPDFNKLHHYCQAYPSKQFVAAGGIRGLEDIARLSDIGIQKALVASCLHSGRLTSNQIAWLQNNR